MRETQPPVIEEVQETEPPKQQNLESYLRDNLFGDDFRIYNEKLEKLTQEIEKTQQNIAEVEARLLNEMSDVKDQYGNIPDNIVQRVDTRIDELISRGENDLEKLSLLINEFATDFQAQIEELQSNTDTIQNNSQVDRQTFADALIRIGTQLKNEE